MARYLKSKVASNLVIDGPISSLGGEPIEFNSPVNLGPIADISIDNSRPNSFIYTDPSGKLQFGTFESTKNVPGFSAQSIILGNHVPNSAQLNATTSVFDAIANLESRITQANVQLLPQRFTFTESLIWRVQHNMGTTQFFESLSTATGKRFSAVINIIDANAFEVRLTQVTAGFVDVIFTYNE